MLSVDMYSSSKCARSSDWDNLASTSLPCEVTGRGESPSHQAFHWRARAKLEYQLDNVTYNRSMSLLITLRSLLEQTHKFERLD
jgi:hypothetical protein